jgi:hypothetical protein
MFNYSFQSPMLITEYLQFPGYVQLEYELFTSYESIELVDIYNMFTDPNIDRPEKLINIKNLLNKVQETSNIVKRKIIILTVFSILNTPFGYSLLQENYKFRQVVFYKYDKFMSEEQTDQIFIEYLKTVKI